MVKLFGKNGGDKCESSTRSRTATTDQKGDPKKRCETFYGTLHIGLPHAKLNNTIARKMKLLKTDLPNAHAGKAEPGKDKNKTA